LPQRFVLDARTLVKGEKEENLLRRNLIFRSTLYNINTNLTINKKYVQIIPKCYKCYKATTRTTPNHAISVVVVVLKRRHSHRKVTQIHRYTETQRHTEKQTTKTTQTHRLRS